MNKKTVVTLLVLFGFIFASCTTRAEKKEPVTLHANSLIEEMSLDKIIIDSELIVIGEVITISPSYWMRQNEKIAEKATQEELIAEEGLFTDSILAITQVIKGVLQDSTVRVRMFIGKTDQFQEINSIEPEYLKGHTYLLFLVKDTGPTQIVEPGDYISVNTIQGVYEIMDGKAISYRDEWPLEDLIAYIQNVLLNSQ